jgi:hypothetical protein
VAKSRVIDRDLGYSRIIRNLKEIGKLRTPAVFVGISADAGTYPDGTPVVLVAGVNEFGSSDGRVPERSYLRSTMDEKRAVYLAALTKASGKGVDFGKGALRRELEALGDRAVKDVQRKIDAIKSPRNAPSTVARKGFDDPLVETERLKRAISSEVKGV